MARWMIRRLPDGQLQVDRWQPGIRGVFVAGRVHACINVTDIVSWIVTQRATSPGDTVALPDGQKLLILAPAPGVS